MARDIMRDILVPEVLFGDAHMDVPRQDGCLRGDLVIDNNRVVDLVPGQMGTPRIVLPGLVEAHCHLDKCHSIHRMEGIGGNLREAITAQHADKVLWTEDDLHHRVGPGHGRSHRLGLHPAAHPCRLDGRDRRPPGLACHRRRSPGAPCADR